MNKLFLAKEEWLNQLSDVITNPIELLQQLRLDKHAQLCAGAKTRQLFKFRVPRSFANRMVPEDPDDPLLRQVFTNIEEFKQLPEFSTDPLNEQNNTIPNLIHKYKNRALLLVKSCCAVNCRYCFRRHFPYKNNHVNKANLYLAIKYIRQHTELNEIILSGGDPLMAKDHELYELINLLDDISHLTTLRIHSRLPVVIPARITDRLCQQLASYRLKIVLVTHINHAREINSELCESMAKLRAKQIILLNQSVLLRGINDNADILAILSEALFSAGILPYYLHMLDYVQGAAHFRVNEQSAINIMQKLLGKVSGYLVPRLVKEIQGLPSKILLDLRLNHQNNY
ncbi:EF-P beta-lysylation protein EpmB [Candidatus Palibaumannia cicadellinicola]|uniref:L-lysine 2,3-aminomutase n=1 Tax=Candidatus Palibaumannia cicadellinicola TaxID=186490 RepID=A0A0K2BLQ3_9GAMM|nr:EF-P beta-lysylation protein EpmB [Candidatus Baumannia cicadellinicola]AKZ66117.1 Lysine 2,3-aminomutase [Candidatus Baumannia cicadellinicola]